MTLVPQGTVLPNNSISGYNDNTFSWKKNKSYEALLVKLRPGVVSGYPAITGKEKSDSVKTEQGLK